MTQNNDSPIFIHSLFRSGSTWLFNRFRNSSEGYWCYQEPYHETLINLKAQPEVLMSIHQETASSLRHPQINRPYFQEFYEIRDEIADKFEKCISFDSFFDPTVCPSFFAYTDSLIAAAKSRPALQCCRSFGRVKHLKNRYGGIHIHLWRNPRDQWLSYQINEFFDATSLAILNAKNPPEFILRLRQELGFQEIRGASFQDEYGAMLRFPWNGQRRYLVFYALWLYSLIENPPVSDIDINIDKLTADDEYNQAKSEELEGAGIKNVNLSECASPMSPIADSEIPFYESIEKHVEDLLLQAGYAPEVVENALEHRKAHQPRRRLNAKMLLESARRARASAMRYADNLAIIQSEIHAIDVEREQLRAEKNQALGEVEKARESEKFSQLQVTEAMAQVEKAKADATRTSAEAYQVMADAFQAKAEAFQVQADVLREQLNQE